LENFALPPPGILHALNQLRLDKLAGRRSR